MFLHVTSGKYELGDICFFISPCIIAFAGFLTNYNYLQPFNSHNLIAVVKQKKIQHLKSRFFT